MRKEYRGRPRSNNTQSFPYEPLVMEGRLVMPAELQRDSSCRPGRGWDYRGHACCGAEALA